MPLATRVRFTLLHVAIFASLISACGGRTTTDECLHHQCHPADSAVESGPDTTPRPIDAGDATPEGSEHPSCSVDAGGGGGDAASLDVVVSDALRGSDASDSIDAFSGPDASNGTDAFSRLDASGADVAVGDAGPRDAGTSGDAPLGCGTNISGPVRWELVASMAQTRTQHSATLLQSGKVLITGGIGGGVSSGADLASAELYDPCTNTWSPAGTLGQPRSGHSAVLLRDGRVLVVGGSQNGSSVATAELYDPLTNLWSPTGAPPGPGLALRLDSGQVLLIGDDVVDNTTALYDPTTGGWSPTGLDAHPRYGFGATLLGSGKVLLSGGFSIAPFAPAVLEAELYDPASATWSPAGALSRMRNGDAPVRLQSGRVLISGGYPQAPSPTPPASTEIYDPGANAWSAGENLLVARWIHTTTLLPSGDVLIAGGSSSSGAGSALASSELYDESTGKFSLTVSLHIARWSHTATLLPDGRVLIVGGNDGTNFLSSVEIYTPDAPASRDAAGDTLAGDGATATVGLEAYWRFDEGVGVIAADSSGQGHTATLTGTQWVAGRDGTSALNLDGTTQFAQTTGAVVNTSRPYSVAAWVQLNQLNGFRTVVGIDGVMVSAFFLQYLPGPLPAFAFVALPSDAPAAASAIARASTSPVAGVWYHIAGVFDGANMKFYLNGVLQQSVPFATPWIATGPTSIGRGRYAGGNADFWPGFIDDVRIYSRALSDTEVEILAQ